MKHSARGYFTLGLIGLCSFLLSSNTLAQVEGAREASQGKGKYHTFVPEPTLSRVSYGDHKRNHLDFWQAESDTPTPVVIYIHGGGWNGNSKESIGGFVHPQTLLDAGISVAAINYRYIKHCADLTPPVEGPMTDSARAVQFIRSMAEEWNLDPDRIGLTGGSAGACASLWVAYHDDRAEPDSDDPVARQSTRVAAVAAIRGQTTLDPKQMKQWIPNSKYGGHAFGFGRDSFKPFLAARNEILPQIEKYSPYAQLTSDDPPTFLYYPIAPGNGKPEKDPTHSATFGVKLEQKAKKLGVPCELVHAKVKNPPHTNATDFLITALKGE